MSAPDPLFVIQEHLGLTTEQLSDLLGIPRETLYRWLAQPEAIPRTGRVARRLRELSRVAMAWHARSEEQLGRLATARIGDGGTSLLDHLRAPRWSDAAILTMLDVIVAHAAAGAAARDARRRQNPARELGPDCAVHPDDVVLLRLRMRGRV